MNLSSPRSWRHLFVAGALSLAVVSCTTSGGNDTADPATSTTSVRGETTISDGDDPVTTTEVPDPTEVTVADLEAILPTAADIGQGYRVKADADDDADDEEDKAVEAALAEACPGIEDAFVNIGVGNEKAATVSMEDSDGRGFEIKLNASPSINSMSLDDQVAAVNGCEAFTYDVGDGSDVTMEMAAERTDDFGEVEVSFTLDLTIENDALPRPVSVRFTSRTFLVGTVSVSVTVSDGFDDTTYQTIPGDADLLDEYSYEMQTRVADLLTG